MKVKILSHFLDKYGIIKRKSITGMMDLKRMISLIILIAIILSLTGCSKNNSTTQIAATTLPVFEFTEMLCSDTGIRVTQVITENVSCLHDYTLQVGQMQVLEDAELIVISGAGLEYFLDDILQSHNNIVDASMGVKLLCSDETHHDHAGHNHQDKDPHYWLSPANGKIMAKNILNALCERYPVHQDVFEENYKTLLLRLDELEQYGLEQLSAITSKNILTFHDGFSYLANAYGLHIIKSIEEESGSEISAANIIELCEMVRHFELSAIFTEKNGSVSAAGIIAAETGVKCYQLDMAVSSSSYFAAMRHNIDILKEALG